MIPAAPTPAPARAPERPWLAPLLLAVAFLPVWFGLDWSTAGSPALDDHIFLRRIALGGPVGWFDGLGHDVYWRPLSRQAEFLLLGPWLERAPWVVPVAHAALLALSAFLLFAALRRALPDGAAAVAASFPLALEASRTVLAFATGMQDLMASPGCRWRCSPPPENGSRWPPPARSRDCSARKSCCPHCCCCHSRRSRH